MQIAHLVSHLPSKIRAILVLVALGGGSVHAQEVSFSENIRPILNAHCVKCHGGVKQAGGVSFVYKDQALGKSKSGATILTPGSLEQSEIYHRITTSDPEDRMPPADESPNGLKAEEIQLLSQWIEQGAKWDEHWAFVPPTRHQAPEVISDANVDWPTQRIDYFILNALQRKGWAPSEEAVPERWLRRVSLDLIGLPPTLAEVDRFVKDLQDTGKAESAYELVVDRLLNSPRFGERWATQWMDQIRYADSRGLGIDERRNIWMYRDWIIDAFNNDLPYDQFTIKQIAGDMLPNPTMEDMIASACNRNTQSSNEGGTDDEEFRVMAVMDRINTTWQAWQGTTFGCVQCHGHPYDPFRHEEYYQFMAYFNNTVDSDMPSDEPTLSVPINRADYAQAAEVENAIKQLEEEIWKSDYAALVNASLWKPISSLEIEVNNSDTEITVEQKGDYAEFVAPGGIKSQTMYTIEAELPADLDQLTAIKITGFPRDLEAARKDSEWGFVISDLKFTVLRGGEDEREEVAVEIADAVMDEAHPVFDPMDSFANNDRGFGAYSRIHYPRQSAFILKEPMKLACGDLLKVEMGHRIFYLGAFPLVTKRGRLDVSGSAEWTELIHDSDRIEKNERLAECKKALREIPSTAIPVMMEREEKFARPTHRFGRGNFLQKEEQVQPGIPDLFKSDGEDPRDRLELARWLVSPENPLTARVAVNRLWEQMFGYGLTLTLEDIGSAGEPPTHPALLDDLAVRFQTDMGWSVKKLLKEIALSATYRQTSKVTPETWEADPENRWLARGPRRRLSAETVRDQALAISGLLSDKMYGEPVRPPIPGGVWKPFASDPWKTAEDEDRYRRAVYVYVKRSIPFPSFAAFDAPSREFCTPRRLSSNTPLQALVTMNDTAFVECAEAFASRMQAVEGEPEDQITAGYRMTLSEAPHEEDLNTLVALYQAALAEYQTEAELVKESAEHSAMTLVAAALLNLDETLTH